MNANAPWLAVVVSVDVLLAAMNPSARIVASDANAIDEVAVSVAAPIASHAPVIVILLDATIGDGASVISAEPVIVIDELAIAAAAAARLADELRVIADDDSIDDVEVASATIVNAMLADAAIFATPTIDATPSSVILDVASALRPAASVAVPAMSDCEPAPIPPGLIAGNHASPGV
jgi:hypothetical protein